MLVRTLQRTIRNLVVMGGLDVTQDFRRHDPEDLAKIYRAVSCISLTALQLIAHASPPGT